MTNVGIPIDIIALQETWTIKYPTLLNIPGYQPLIYCNRTKGRGGGIGYYIRNGISYKILHDLSSYHDKIFESLTLDITYISNNMTKHFIISNIYRSPTQVAGLTNRQQMEEFHDKLDNLMIGMTNLNLDSYIFLDANINLHDIDTDEHAMTYMTNITNNGFILTNHRTTRIQNDSATLIDHILTNSKNMTINSGTLINDISDHFITYIQPNLSRTKTKPDIIKKRQYNKTNLDNFKTNLQNINWDDVTMTTTVDECYDKFWDIYNLLHDQHFPMTTTKFNRNKHKISEFMTVGLLTSRSTKIKLHKIALTDNTHDNWNKYRTYRNLFNKTIRNSKKLHYETQLRNNAKNPKKTWDTLRELTTGKTTKAHKDKIVVDNCTITDEQTMADEFNKFFSQAGKKIYETVSPITTKPTDYVQDKDIPPLEFRNIQQAEVIETINNMEPKTSIDASGINSKMLKFIKYEIAKPLTHLFNLSITTGVFPAKLKVARTIPIFKAGDNTSCDNYRPISLLSAISKVLEKIVARSLVNHLEENNLIYENQYGFLKNRSTVHNILQLTNKIAKELNERKFVIGVFLDLRKAFDVVSHDILIDKLRKLGINNKALDWFISYLNNRQQYVDINGKHSTKRLIDISVIQGSILGPILFICFINDLHLATDLLTLLFADDTAAIDSDIDLPTLIDRVNGEIQKIANWFRANRMAVNVTKTKYIVFRPRGTKITIDLDKDGLVYNDNELGKPTDINKISKLGRIHNDNTDKTERQYKFLGVYIDEYLSFDYHCTHIGNKLAASNFIINRAKNLLSPNTLKTLYYSLIHPHLLYCLPIYSCTSQKNINKIFNMQKKAIRTITKSKYNAHTSPLFASLNILPFNHLITLTKGILVHSIYHKYSPSALHSTWTTNRDRNIDTGLRNEHDIYIPFARTDHVKKLPLYSLPRTWNDLPDDRMTNNPTTFKIALKDHLRRLTEQTDT